MDHPKRSLWLFLLISSLSGGLACRKGVGELERGLQTVRIGGTATGVEGTVKLTSKTLGALNVEADGAFWMPGSIGANQPYSIAIADNANDMACSLSGASGISSVADTSPVELTCAPLRASGTYPLSVEVHGLLPGYKVQVHEGDDEVELANGQVQLAAGRRPGSALSPAVGVVSGQSCFLVDPPRTMPAAPTTLEVTCSPKSLPVAFAAAGLPAAAKLDVEAAAGTPPLQLTGAGPTGTWPTGLPFGSTFTAHLVDVNNRSRCTFADGTTTLSGQVAVASPAIAITCRGFLPLASGQAASVVVGQGDFVTGSPQGGSTGWGGDVYSDPHVDAAGALYIAVGGENRVIGYNQVPSTNGVPIDFSFTADGYPLGLTTRAQAMAVGLKNDHQVRIFSHLLRADDTPAVTLGSDHSCDASGLTSVEGVRSFGDTLGVPDSACGRVTFWRPWPGADAAAADLVLGQSSMSVCDPQAISATSLGYPEGLWFDGLRTIVADSGHNRVTIWHAPPSTLTSGQPADVVLGAADFVTAGSAAPTAATMGPNKVVSNGTQLFVVDSANSRVLVWNTIPTTNGQPADVVLGQPNMTATGCNGGGPVTATSLCEPYGVAVTDDAVLVVDRRNYRLLVFAAASP